MTITNTTIANNVAAAFGASAGGGVFIGPGTAVLTNVTVADNHAGSGGGLFVGIGTTVTLQNTILARNTANPGPFGQGPDCSGTIVSLGNNIIGNTADCTIDLASTISSAMRAWACLWTTTRYQATSTFPCWPRARRSTPATARRARAETNSESAESMLTATGPFAATSARWSFIPTP